MMHRVRLTVAAALVAFPALAGSAPRPLIKDNAEIFHRLLVTAVANEIRVKCKTIDARKISATLYVFGILNYARSQGFSMAEINAYKKDPAEQARLRREGYAYLDSHGVNRKKSTGYCALGKAEIAGGSEIGKLLKVVR